MQEAVAGHDVAVVSTRTMVRASLGTILGTILGHRCLLDFSRHLASRCAGLLSRILAGLMK
jgi:hypothetical protein